MTGGWVDAAWVGLAALTLAGLVVAARSNGRLPGPGPMVRRRTGAWWAEAAALGCWMWLGWHAFAR